MLRLNDISFQYQNHFIFSDLNIHIPVSSLWLAPNGTGKTTLLKLIAGILSPQSGTILFRNNLVFSASSFFNSNILLPQITIQSHINWIKKHFSIQAHDFLQTIDAFELTPFLNATPNTLSDGQKQWIALALTMSVPADIYLLDEPLRSLDEQKIDQFSQILSERLKQNQFFFITGHKSSHSALNTILPAISI